MSFDPTNPLHLGMRELLAIALHHEEAKINPRLYWKDAPARDRNHARSEAEQIMSGDLAGAYGEGEE